MATLKNQLFASLRPILAGLLLLSACASPPRPTPAAPTPSAPPPTSPPVHTSLPPAPTPPPLPTSAPRIFTLALPAGPGTLDPAQAVDENALLITRHLYEGLTRFAPGSTAPAPQLAERWESSPDGLTWTFHLRPGVAFSSGLSLTAEIAALNFTRWLSATPPGNYAFWRLMFGGFAGQAGPDGQPLAALVSVTAVDDLTLVLTLRQADASLPATLAMPAFALVDPAAFPSADFGQPGAASAGTGPFQLKAWDVAHGLVYLERNPVYWGPAARPDELIFKTVADDLQRLLALQAGEIDGLARLNPREYAAAQADPKLRVEFDPGLSVLYLGFNQARAPWSNLDCRLALALALDPQRYARRFFPGDGAPALAMQPPAAWGYTAPANPRQPDPAQAAAHWQACQAAGTKMPEAVQLYIPPSPRPYLPNPAGLGLAIQSDLSATLGLSVTLLAPDWQKEWLPAVQNGQADLFLLGWTSVNGDPDGYLCALFCGQLAAFNSDPQTGQPRPPDADLAAWLLAARANLDPVQRQAAYAQANQRIFETVPALPLATRASAWAYRAPLTNTVPSPIENLFFDLTWSAP